MVAGSNKSLSILEDYIIHLDLLLTIMAKVAHVKEIREHAKIASLQAVAGASALSVLTSARTLADAGLVQEQAADLTGALYKYSQAAK